MDLTDAQWAILEPTFRPRRRPDRRGRPWADPRAVLNGVLWVLRTGAPSHALPRRYPPYQTCHRRFQQWQRRGRLDRLLQPLAEAPRPVPDRDHCPQSIAWPHPDPRRPRPAALPAPVEDRTPVCVAAQLPTPRDTWEYHVANFLGMLQLACARILLRHL